MMYYNCTPQTSAFVLGLASSMEEQYYEDPVSFNPESISAVKTSLMGPLSGWVIPSFKEPFAYWHLV